MNILKKADEIINQRKEEKERMFAWNLTAKTILSVREWETLFEKVGYAGDYYWFIP